MYGSRAYKHWGGNPHINTRVNREIYQKVRTVAAQRGCTVSEVAREIFLEWSRSVNVVLSPAAPPAVPVAPALPQTAPARPDTGRSEPASLLQRIDADRVASRGTGPVLKD